MDEIHHYGAPSNVTFLKESFFALILGLSATPHREDTDILEKYAPVVFKYSRKSAIQDKVISKYSVIFKSVELSKLEQFNYFVLQDFILKNKHLVYDAESYMKIPYRLRQAYEKRRKLLNNSESRIEEVVRLINYHKTKKIIIFSEYIKTAEAIYDLVDKKECGIYHSGTEHDEKTGVLSKFKNNKIRVLITCKCLDEGIDVPDCDCGIIVSGTKTTRQTIQRLGRILRKSKGKHARLYFLYVKETIERFDMQKKQSILKLDAHKITWR